MVVLAALKKFGLLEDEGSGEGRRARLTDLALDIVLEGSPARAEAIRAAAVAPGIHQELLQAYPDGLPSDASLIYNLERERGFTPGAARELVKELRRTLAYAGVAEDGGGSLSRQESDTRPAEEGPQMSPAAQQPAPSPHTREPASSYLAAGDVTYPIPLPDGKRFSVQGTFPLSEDDWEYVMSSLTLMKRGLVVRRPSADES